VQRKKCSFIFLVLKSLDDLTGQRPFPSQLKITGMSNSPIAHAQRNDNPADCRVGGAFAKRNTFIRRSAVVAFRRPGRPRCRVRTRRRETHIHAEHEYRIDDGIFARCKLRRRRRETLLGRPRGMSRERRATLKRTSARNLCAY